MQDVVGRHWHEMFPMSDELRTFVNDILARLEASTAPDRKLDAAVYSIAGGLPSTEEQLEAIGRAPILSAYTEDIDAIVRLVKGHLPGWGWRIGTCCVSDDAWLFPDTNDPVHGVALAERYAHLDDPVAWFLDKTDVDLRPAGRQAVAMCMSFLLALKHIEGV